MDAEQGLAGGAAINVAIKSGSNDFHGSAFEYHSDQKIKAYPWNDPRTDRKAKFIDNQFGGTIGGPIKKDKIFFPSSRVARCRSWWSTMAKGRRRPPRNACASSATPT
jgi:hypothetical protein